MEAAPATAASGVLEAAAAAADALAEANGNGAGTKRPHGGDAAAPLAAMPLLAAPGPSSTPGAPEFIDRRITIKTKFRLFCFVGRKCIIRNFKPADFKPTCASWGWTDDEGMFPAACAEGSLRVCVVLENV